MTETVNWRGRARTYALTQLTHEHWQRYRELLEDVHAEGEYARPQSRARTLLSHEFPLRMRELYLAEKARLMSLPEEQRRSRRAPYIHVRMTSNRVRTRLRTVS